MDDFVLLAARDTQRQPEYIIYSNVEMRILNRFKRQDHAELALQVMNIQKATPWTLQPSTSPTHREV